MFIPETQLEVYSWDKHEADCTGCGKKIPPKTLLLEGSFDDNEGLTYYFRLCSSCVRAAHQALNSEGPSEATA